jgi:hypothetical protein
MEKDEVKSILLEVINELRDKRGWTNLVHVGRPLRERGVDHKALGYEKLFQLIRDHRDSIVWKVDRRSNPGVLIIHVKEKTQQQKRKYKQMAQRSPEDEATFSTQPKNALTNWGSMGDFIESIQTLKSVALEERWYYSQQNPQFPYPILSNYLKYTFYRLSQEPGKVLSNEKYAAFNTGLVDLRYEPIFAFFERTPNAVRQWRLIAFCIAGEEWPGKELIRQFKTKPPRAHYFDNVNDMLYDTRAGKPECDWNHIIIENVNRLPQGFISNNQPTAFKLLNVDDLDFDQRRDYYERLSKAIEADKKTYRNITFRLKDALDLALKRVDWNFKTAIPQYFPTRNAMSLLLPLALLDDEVVDVAMVVEKTPSGNYLGHTILPLEWAYSNARLVCRPDSDWLVADRIEEELDEEHVIEIED